MIISVAMITLVFFMNEMINRAISEISASNINILINGSAVNNPTTNKRTKGIRIVAPFKKIKK